MNWPLENYFDTFTLHSMHCQCVKIMHCIQTVDTSEFVFPKKRTDWKYFYFNNLSFTQNESYYCFLLLVAHLPDKSVTPSLLNYSCIWQKEAKYNSPFSLVLRKAWHCLWKRRVDSYTLCQEVYTLPLTLPPSSPFPWQWICMTVVRRAIGSHTSRGQDGWTVVVGESQSQRTGLWGRGASTSTGFPGCHGSSDRWWSASQWGSSEAPRWPKTGRWSTLARLQLWSFALRVSALWCNHACSPLAW